MSGVNLRRQWSLPDFGIIRAINFALPEQSFMKSHAPKARNLKNEKGS
jgi:hypothetical protein